MGSFLAKHKPAVLQLGETPCSPQAQLDFLNQVGSILRFETLEAFEQAPLDVAGLKAKGLVIEGLLCGPSHLLTVAHLQRLPNLRVISHYGNTVSHLPLLYIQQQNILLCHTLPGLTPQAMGNAMLVNLCQALAAPESPLH